VAKQPYRPDTSPDVDNKGWTSRYSCTSKGIGSFHLAVTYSQDQKTTPGYTMEVNQQKLKAIKEDFASARLYTVQTALKWAKSTVVALEAELKALEEGDGG
jgi:hypothetical protein